MRPEWSISITCSKEIESLSPSEKKLFKNKHFLLCLTQVFRYLLIYGYIFSTFASRIDAMLTIVLLNDR